MQEKLRLTDEEAMELSKKVDAHVRSIPDFPEPGIIFRDITTVTQTAEALNCALDAMEKHVEWMKDDIDVIVGLESRGFIFGMPVARDLNKGFIPVRKKGKLPCETVSQSYDLEYGTAEIEIHTDAIKPGQKVLIVDDLIATGGTIEAAIKLVEKLGGEVIGCLFLIELAGLNGREKLKNYNVEAVVTYEGK